MNHPVELLRIPKETDKTVTKFRQVTGQVLWADAMMDTKNITFDISEQCMDPEQDLRRLFFSNRKRASYDGGTNHPGNYTLANHRY